MYTFFKKVSPLTCDVLDPQIVEDWDSVWGYITKSLFCFQTTLYVCNLKTARHKIMHLADPLPGLDWLFLKGSST